MIQHNYKVNSIGDVNTILQLDEIIAANTFKSQLVQVFSAQNDIRWYQSISKRIKKSIPSAIIVGASSVGEINEGKIFTDSTVVLFSFFESTDLTLLSFECKLGDEEIVGKELLKATQNIKGIIKGMLLLTTPISNDSGKIFNTLNSEKLSFPIFGGGAGDYANERKTLVFDGENYFKKGLVAVVFLGESLHIELLSSLGWVPLSKEMTITETGSVSVKTIDNMPAFTVYKKYLGIKADSHFFQNSLEFPFLINRNNQIIARTPFFVNEEDGSIQLVAEVMVGEKFRIGYGNPHIILEESTILQQQMQEFNPEAIFLYSCICRRFLMQDEVDLETLPFNQIAPTGGFYTFGEFCANNEIQSLLNSSLVTVGMREGQNNKFSTIIKKQNKRAQEVDPYAKQHNRILSRLLYFIDELIKEFDEQNEKLKLLIEQKNMFLGMAAHDLRSPIIVVQGFAGIIEESVSGENKEFASIIAKQSHKMLSLLNDILDFSMIEAGKIALKKEKVDYLSIVTQNINMNRIFAQKKQIKISYEFEINDQVMFIDSGKIEQVLNNIIGNAIKYSYPDSTIHIKVLASEDMLVTEIQDQGDGIPPHEIVDIFSPFKKSSVLPTGGEASHGLGLAIVKKIIEEHGGKVGVNSELGIGSQFYFMLPINT
jgi:signal transduction histidine kinase